MIKAILWDFGGVITTSPFAAFEKFERARGLPKDFIRGINSTNPDANAWAQLESNDIDSATFDALFAAEAQAAGHEVRGAEVLALLSGDIQPAMVNALKLCKRHFRIGCITNNVKSATKPGTPADPAKSQQMRAVMGLFDLVVESSVEGIRKPDPQIYLLACERLAVAPNEALFLDDLGINLKPARALGMQTIKVVSAQQAISELGRLTGLDFSA